MGDVNSKVARKEQEPQHAIGPGNQFAQDLHKQHVQSLGHQRGKHELNSDEQISNILHRQDFSELGATVFGKVVYAAPYIHWYRVNLDEGGDIICCGLSQSTLTPIGVRDTSCYPIGAHVAVWLPPEALYGYIMGVVPSLTQDGALVFPDAISQGSNVGFKREAYYHELLDLCQEEAGAMDFNCDRPLDTLNGDWGKINEFGGGFHTDSFMTFMRVNEICGLYLFYMDNLARLAGHSLDIRTCCSDLIVRDDAQEPMHFHGYAPFGWEAMGAWKAGTEIHREEEDDDVHFKKPVSKLEPKEDDQVPFYRYQEYHGYLGQAFMRQLIAPPDGVDEEGVNRRSSEQNPVGLFREMLAMDGAYGLASAHSIAIVKRPVISYPSRLKDPEEPSGDYIDKDGQGNYKFASEHGPAEDHKVSALKAEDDLPTLQEVATLTDFAAHLFEWKGLHPFYYHKKDFRTPEQDENTPLSTLQTAPQYGKLSTDTWLPDPEAREVQIDHRYEKAELFETTAGLYFLPRGGVALRGGGTEEIRMAGGSIDIGAPGDVYLRPGRNVNIFAADDCIIKVHKSVDITATQKDVRIKAERNLQMLGGNDVVGGVLIESRAPGPSYDFLRKGEGGDTGGEEVAHGGIILRAPKADVVSWGKRVYLRTGGGDVEEGAITIDSSKGNQDIFTVSRAKLNHIMLVKSDAFPVQGAKTVANNYSAGNAQIHTPLQIDGSLVVTKDGILAQGWIALVGGHIGTELSPQFNFLVGWLTGGPLAKAKSALSQVASSMQGFKASMTENYTKGIVEQWYLDKQGGNDGVMTYGKFGLRTDKQMNTKKWELPENYWQQTATLTEQTFSSWEENDVQGPIGTQQPYPGKTKWQSNTFLRIDLTLHDPKEGRDKKRADNQSAFESPTLANWTRDVPDQKYPVIVS
jgi:hypothetical protein